MQVRRLAVVPSLLLALSPGVATGQSADTAPAEFGRFSLEAGGGALLNSGGGHTLSAAFGFSPVSRVDILVSVERNHLPFQRNRFGDGVSLTRGGTLASVSGEVRASLFAPHRFTPYALAGIGGGVSRPTVNDAFPEPIENQLRVVYFGGGVRVPLRNGLSLFGDARAMLAVEADDGLAGMWPVRAGIAWRF